ncbi:hypothetical protein BGZ73_009033 [Actinomortierella ambigua]|nr:hypothetical protein BGZ73_009033 [Actinomortierella ambigua]
MKEHHSDPDEPVVPVSMLRIDSARNSPLTQTSPHLSVTALCSTPTSQSYQSTFDDANCIKQQQQQQEQQQSYSDIREMDQPRGDDTSHPPPTCMTGAVFAAASLVAGECPHVTASQAAHQSTIPAGNDTPNRTSVTSNTSTSTSMSTNTSTTPSNPSFADTVPSQIDSIAREPSPTRHLGSDRGDDSTDGALDARPQEELLGNQVMSELDSNRTNMMMEDIEYASPSLVTSMLDSGHEQGQAPTGASAAAEQSHSEANAIGFDSHSAAAMESLSTPTHSEPSQKSPSDYGLQYVKGNQQEGGMDTADLKAVTRGEAYEAQGDDGHDLAEEKEPNSIHPTIAQPTVTATSSSCQGQGSIPTTAPPPSSTSSISSSSPPSSSSSSSLSSSSSSSSSEPTFPLQGVIAFNEAVYTAVHYSSELYIIPRASRGFCWNEDLFLKPYQRRSLGLVDHLYQQHLQQRHHQQQSFRYGSPFQSSNNLHNASNADASAEEGEILQQSSSPLSDTSAQSSQHQEINGGRSSSPSLHSHESMVTVHEIWLDDHETASILPM